MVLNLFEWDSVAGRWIHTCLYCTVDQGDGSKPGCMVQGRLMVLNLFVP